MIKKIYEIIEPSDKLDSSWFMPTLQQKEALASSALEGTQATLDGVLTNQVSPNEKDVNLNEVKNYYIATLRGNRILSREDFSNEFFCEIHKILMDGNVRKPDVIGEYRNIQNYIGKNDDSHSITYTPPTPDRVKPLMNNLVEYINQPTDNHRTLVRIAIIHAQFETIHPFKDGNGRVGRLLIPLYLYAKNEIELPCFFISEALERDKHKYYNLLNNTREKRCWNEWIKFFLETVAKQCEKYISIISEINKLYDKHLTLAKNLIHSTNVVDIINVLYKYPVIRAKQLSQMTGVPIASVNRYLSILVDNSILYTDEKIRNKDYFYYDLLSILR